MNCSRKKLGLAVVLAQSAMAVPLVHAQATLEEIVVTAERREASLQETDISMAVFSSKALDEMGITNYAQLGDYAPNVMTHEMPGKSGAAVSIRGFKNAETIATFEPKVALYVDGVLIAKNAGSVFDVLDLERIEILRGPQGTLYGRNTVGGAVNIITKKPYDEFGGKLKVTLGDYGRNDYNATVNVPLMGSNGVLWDGTDQQLNLKVTLADLNRDGYFDNTYLNTKTADRDRRVGHLQLQWLPTDSLSFLYAFDGTKVNETPWPYAVVNATAAPLQPYAGNENSSDRPSDLYTWMNAKIYGHSLTVDWELADNFSLVSISAYRHMKNDSWQDSDNTPVPWFMTWSGDQSKTYTQELRGVGTLFDDDLKYVVGAFYMHEDIENIYTYSAYGFLRAAANYAPPYTAPGQNGNALNKNWAIFGEGTYSITDKLDFTLGLRYTDEKREMERINRTWLGFTSWNNPGTAFDVVYPDVSKDFDDVSGTAGFQYQWTDTLMTYLKASKGYVTGGYNIRSPTRPGPGFDPVAFYVGGYDDETVWTYEFGWKTTWWDDRLLFNGAVFYNDYSDLQVNVLTPDGQNAIDNAGDAEIYGAEVEVQVVPIDNLEIGVAYGYLHPKYKEYISGGQDLSENDWAHAPDNSVSSYVRYTIPGIGDGIGDLSFRVDYSYVDDYALLTARQVPPSPFYDSDNRVDGYNLINARISLDSVEVADGTTFSVAAWARNITDETYYTSGFNLNSNLGFNNRATAPPRTIGVDLELAF